MEKWLLLHLLFKTELLRDHPYNPLPKKECGGITMHIEYKFFHIADNFDTQEKQWAVYSFLSEYPPLFKSKYGGVLVF